MQLRHTVDADRHGHKLMVLCQQVLHLRGKPHLAVGGKAGPHPRPQGALPLPALLEPVVQDVLDQLGFQQRLPADEVQHDALCVPIDKVPGTALPQVDQIIHDPLTRFPAHGSAALVVLVAVRAAQVAVSGHLDGNIAGNRSLFRSLAGEHLADQLGIFLVMPVHRSSPPAGGNQR